MMVALWLAEAIHTVRLRSASFPRGLPRIQYEVRGVVGRPRLPAGACTSMFVVFFAVTGATRWCWFVGWNTGAVRSAATSDTRRRSKHCAGWTSPEKLDPSTVVEHDTDPLCDATHVRPYDDLGRTCVAWPSGSVSCSTTSERCRLQASGEVLLSRRSGLERRRVVPMARPMHSASSRPTNPADRSSGRGGSRATNVSGHAGGTSRSSHHPATKTRPDRAHREARASDPDGVEGLGRPERHDHHRVTDRHGDRRPSRSATALRAIDVWRCTPERVLHVRETGPVLQVEQSPRSMTRPRRRLDPRTGSAGTARQERYRSRASNRAASSSPIAACTGSSSGRLAPSLVDRPGRPRAGGRTPPR